jgi:glucose-6-phosphate 1-dehydrogenase
MEPPASFSSAALQNEQVKALEAVPPINPDECSDCVVRGQYTARKVGENRLWTRIHGPKPTSR